MTVKGKKSLKKDKISKKKKWLKPRIKEYSLQDEDSYGLEEVLLAPNDPVVS